MCVRAHAHAHVCMYVCVRECECVYVPMWMHVCGVFFFLIEMIFWVDSAVTLNSSYLRVISPLQLTFFKPMILYFFCQTPTDQRSKLQGLPTSHLKMS